MKRRDMLAATLAAPAILATRTAHAAERTIGWISPEASETIAPFLTAFHAALREHSGSDPIRVLERFSDGGQEAIANHVAELQRLGVQVIVAQGAATPPVVNARPAVPVVFGYSGDPVVAGFAQSLARPGGNATGVTFMQVELNPKRIDLVRTILPACRRVALLSNTRHAGEEKEIAACQQAVAPLGIELSVHRIQAPADLAPALSHALDAGAQAVVALPSATVVRHAPMLAAGCIRGRVPLISGWSQIARTGALLTYGPNLREAYRRVAQYVVRVLGGAAPGTLPIEQPTVLELAINMKTAAALDLTLPPSLLLQADEIIE
jgi:putative ABC transport system substrate-binding protein